MTERIIELAREAGGTVIEPYDYGAKPDRMVMRYECIKRFAALVRAEALEQAAEVCKQQTSPLENADRPYNKGVAACVTAIRTLKDQP